MSNLTPGSSFMVGLDSLLRHWEIFGGGKVPTESIRQYVHSFQPQMNSQNQSEEK